MSRDESRRRHESAAHAEETERDAEHESERWDANDTGQREDPKDHFAPPPVPCECWCMHCRRVFMSDQIWFQRVINDPQGFEGFWKCPTPNCSGAGFTFDIHPTDPDHPANEGWCYDDDEEGEEDFDAEAFDAGDADGVAGDWDPEEPTYKALDDLFGDDGDDDDLEGEEWKFGLQPGERPPEPNWMEQARREHEEEEARYDQPDERPRVIDWGNRPDRRESPKPFDDDDIPF